jgi:hypothetical protein
MMLGQTVVTMLEIPADDGSLRQLSKVLHCIATLGIVLLSGGNMFPEIPDSVPICYLDEMLLFPCTTTVAPALKSCIHAANTAHFQWYKFSTGALACPGFGSLPFVRCIVLCFAQYIYYPHSSAILITVWWRC